MAGKSLELRVTISRDFLLEYEYHARRGAGPQAGPDPPHRRPQAVHLPRPRVEPGDGDGARHPGVQSRGEVHQGPRHPRPVRGQPRADRQTGLGASW